jgi:hypothetical protein
VGALGPVLEYVYKFRYAFHIAHWLPVEIIVTLITNWPGSRKVCYAAPLASACGCSQ